MDSVLQAELRKFVSGEHIRNVLTGQWVDLFDNHGLKLAGIRGRIGVSAQGISGREIGLDLMEMQPGSAFPLHTHSGDHVIYVISGRGFVHVDGKNNLLAGGDSIFIPAELPHGFNVCSDAAEALIFVAVGHPHENLSSSRRMRLTERASENITRDSSR